MPEVNWSEFSTKPPEASSVDWGSFTTEPPAEQAPKSSGLLSSVKDFATSGQVLSSIGQGLSELPSDVKNFMKSRVAHGRPTTDETPSVMANYTAPEAAPVEEKGAPIGEGFGPIRADRLAAIKQEVAKLNSKSKSALAKQSGIEGVVARKALADEEYRDATGVATPDQTINDILSAPPKEQDLTTAKRDVGYAESAARGIMGQGAGEVGSYVGHLLSVPAIVMDKIASAWEGEPSTERYDAVASALIDPFQRQIEAYAIDAKKEYQSTGGQVATALGHLAVQLPLMIAGGGEAEAVSQSATVLKNVGTMLWHGTKSAFPVALTAATQAATESIKEGESADTAAKKFYLSLATNQAMMIMPLSAEGGVATRVATSVPNTAAIGALSAQAHNAVLPDQQVPLFSDDPVPYITQAALAGLMGPRAAAMRFKAPTHAELGQAMDEAVSTSRFAVPAEDVALSALNPDNAQIRRVNLNRIAEATSVDDAISAFQTATSEPVRQPARAVEDTTFRDQLAAVNQRNQEIINQPVAEVPTNGTRTMDLQLVQNKSGRLEVSGELSPENMDSLRSAADAYGIKLTSNVDAEGNVKSLLLSGNASPDRVAAMAEKVPNLFIDSDSVREAIKANEPEPTHPLQKEWAETPETAVQKPGWGIITATREAVGKYDKPENLQANRDLEQELKNRKIPYDVLPKGSFLNEEQGTSFRVYADTPTIDALTTKYQQDASLTHEGFRSGEGKITLASDHSKTVFGDSAVRRGNFSVEKSGKPFSVGFHKEVENVRGQERVNLVLRGNKFAKDAAGRPVVDGEAVEAVSVETLPVHDRSAGEHPISQELYGVLSRFAEFGGADLTIFDHPTLADGSVSPSHPEHILLSKDSTVGADVVFGHEFTHVLEFLSPDSHEKLMTVIKDELKPEALAVARKHHDKDNVMTDQQLLSEIAGDLSGNATRGKDFWNRITASLVEKYGKTAAGIVIRDVARTLNTLSRRLSELISGGKFTEEGKDIAQSYVKNIGRVNKAIEDAFAEHIGNMALQKEMIRAMSERDVRLSAKRGERNAEQDISTSEVNGREKVTIQKNKEVTELARLSAQRMTPPEKEHLAEAYRQIVPQADMFRYPISKEKTMEGIVHDVGFGLTVKDISFQLDGEGKRWRISSESPRPWRALDEHMDVVEGTVSARFATREEAQAYVNAHPQHSVSKEPTSEVVVTQEGKGVYVNAINMGEGKMGSKVYAIVGNFAKNNHLVFYGDPEGITEAGMRRRLENMASLALKFGGTDFLMPHPDMLTRFPEADLKWYNGKNNLPNLISASYNVVSHLAPEINDVTYDFKTGKFNTRWSEFTQADFDDLAKRLHSGAYGGGAPGSSTLKIAALTGTLVRRAAREGWGPVLASLSEGRAQAVRLGGLEQTRYSPKRSEFDTQGDLFPHEIANRNSTIKDLVVVSSKGLMAEVERGNVNSEGHQITGTIPGMRNFWDWFDGSEVTDDRGRPLVVYHGTGADITSFESGRETTNYNNLGGEWQTRRAGMFFTDDRNLANSFAETFDKRGNITAKEGGNVVPVYLAIKNPADFSKGVSEQLEADLVSSGYGTRMLYSSGIDMWELFDYDNGGREFVEALKSSGYDGALITENVSGEAKNVYVAFEPGVVKSAVGNRGSFSAGDPDIRYSPKREGQVTVEGVHFSQEKRDVLEGGKFGTGIKGAEHQRVEEATDPRLKNRIAFYVDEGQGVFPEEGVGKAEHKVALDNLYDLVSDPLKLRTADLNSVNRDTAMIARNDMESAVLDNGFDGYYVRGAFTRQGVATLLGDAAKRVEVGQGAALSPKRDEEIKAIAGKAYKHLTEPERAKLRRNTAEKLAAIFSALPSADEFAAIAHAGRAKRGWYANSAQALTHVFGADAPRFTALLAAMSPQVSVESNLLNALATWRNWIAAGRPTDREGIVAVMGRSVQGNRGADSVLDAWINNSVRALSTEQPESLTISGPKVNSFMLNLRGHVDEVTNDAWMSNYALVDQTIFSGRLNKGGDDPGKGAGYLAMSARVREAAKRLTKLTGDTWTPAEVQETVWSWAKTIYEQQAAGVTARDVLKRKESLHELIASTPDFRNQLHEAKNEEHLNAAGYGEQLRSLRGRSDLGRAEFEGTLTGREAGPFAEDTQRRHEERAARRLEELKRQREAGVLTSKEATAAAREEGLLDEEGTVYDEPMFSRKRIVGDSGKTYTPEQRAAMERTGSIVTEKTVRETLHDLRQQSGKRLAQGLVDQFRPIRDLSAEAYALARVSKGSAGAFEAFMHYGKLSIKDGAYDADRSGGLLEKVFYPLGKETTDFLRWIAGNRAERLALQGKERLFAPADIAAFKSLQNGTTDFDYTLSTGTVTRNRTAIYRDSLDKFNAFNKNVLDMAEQSGLIDGASRPVWEHEFYVPFYRVLEDEGGVRGGGVTKGVVRQEAFKKLKGGTEQLNDLLANTLMNWSHLIEASAKNRAALATLKDAVNLGVATRVPAGGKGTVWAMENGRKSYYKVDDPYLLAAINGLEYAGMRGPIMDALSKPKHWLTVGVTASPFFKIRNLIRDSVQAIATADLNYNAASNVAKGFAHTSRKNPSQEFVSALAGGGLIRFGTMLEGNEASRTRQLIKQGASDEHILDTESKVRWVYDKLIEPIIAAYNDLGNRGEEITRMALYTQLRAKGVDHLEASLQARDLMDFSMQGAFTSVRFLTQLVPFMNARLQGLYKLGRAGAEDPARFAITLSGVTAASLALLALYHDDDDWKKREDWDRDNYWWFKVGSMAFRIPKPFEIGAIATLAERSAEKLFDIEMTGERYRKLIFKLAMDQLSMNPVPQAVKPIVDIYANKDSFSGRPIETAGMEKLMPEYRFRQDTSLPARGASTALGGALSPVQIDHLVRGYTGWLGTFVVGGTDMLARSVSNEPSKPAMDAWKFATGGMVSELKGAPSRYTEQMYQQAQELEQAYGTWRSLLKTGKSAEAAEFRSENVDKLNKYRLVESVKGQSAKLSAVAKSIERSALPPDEKKEKIQQVRDQQNKLAKMLYVKTPRLDEVSVAE